MTQEHTNYCPWEHAYQLCKPHYTKEQIDEMLLCEVEELIYSES